MTDFNTSPKQNQYKSQIVGELLEATTVPFVLNVKKAVGYTLGAGEKLYVILEPNTVNEEGLLVNSIGGGGNDLTVEQRGLPTYEGGPSTAKSHGGGSTVIISDNWQTFDDIATAVNSKFNSAGGTITGSTTVQAPLIVSGTSSYVKLPELTTVQRDALVAAEGMIIKNTTTGLIEGYFGGAWQAFDTGVATPNGTTVVAGKYETATAAESIAGTNVGGTGASLVVLPKQIANNIQSGTFIYAESTTGNDSYSATLVPGFTGYTNGMRVAIRVDTTNTGACTLELNSQGAVDIKLYSSGNPMSGTITAGNIMYLMFDATNVRWILLNVPPALTDGNDASLIHYHNLVKNNALAGNQKKFYRLKDSTYVTTGTGSNVDTTTSVITGANNNDLSQIVLNFHTLNAVTTANVVNQHPEFRVSGAWASGAAQEGFIGFINGGSFVGTSLENSVMILDHFGFIVQDGTLFISCGDGAAQTKTDISATVPSVTAGHVFAASFDAITGIATFTVDNVSVGTINTTVPNSNLSAFSCAVIADASAVAKTINMDVAGWVAHDES